MSDCPNCDAGELYPTTPGWVVCRNCGSTWRTAVWYMDVTDEHEMSDDTVRNLHSVDGLLGLIRYRKETLSDTELDLSIGHVRSAIARIAELETLNKKLLEVAELSSIRFTDQLTALQAQLAEANTELQKANDEIREWKRHR